MGLGRRAAELRSRAGVAGGEPHWALLGTFLHEGERLADAVKRSLRERRVCRPVILAVAVFDRPNRGWVLSVAYFDVVPRQVLVEPVSRDDVDLVDVVRPRRLKWDHAESIELPVADLREPYDRDPDPASVLPRAFMLRKLRLVHEAVLGQPIQRDNFRRLFVDRLTAASELRREGRERPAVLYGK